jgi:hypothetical protein
VPCLLPGGKLQQCPFKTVFKYIAGFSFEDIEKKNLITVSTLKTKQGSQVFA